MAVQHAFSRRLWLASLAMMGSGFGLGGRIGSVAASDGRAAISQPDSPVPQAFMARAYAMRDEAERAGDQSFGAVIVQDGRIVGQAPSRVVTRGDPTAHAEMEAIRDAAARLTRRDLGGSVIYSSSRPCAMCEAAAYWAGITRMIHGPSLTDGGPPRLGRC